MPNAKVLEEKKAIVASLAEKLQNSVAGVVVDYTGTSVSDDTALRKELREAGVEYFVVKNTLLRRAIEGTNLESINEVLEGTTALAISKDDYVSAARILCKFAESHESFKVKAGYLDGEAIDIEKIESLAKLPSREVLLATVVGAFQAPIASFARAVQAIVDKNEGGEAAAE
ncbi:MAG: 50S ribosomal protein L10 [Ruminococcaceae bacterium]|nr:50S ribosomal protein L10 [Oscillospiraceae bacterium]